MDALPGMRTRTPLPRPAPPAVRRLPLQRRARRPGGRDRQGAAPAPAPGAPRRRPPTTTLLGTVVAENLVSTITWVVLVVRDRHLPAAALLRLVRVHRARGRLPGDRASWRCCRAPGRSSRRGSTPARSGPGPRGRRAPLGGGAREPPRPARPPPDEHRGRREPRHLARAVGRHLLHPPRLRARARRLGRRRPAAGHRHPRPGLPGAPGQPAGVPGRGRGAADGLLRRERRPRRSPSRSCSRPPRRSSAWPSASSSCSPRASASASCAAQAEEEERAPGPRPRRPPSLRRTPSRGR